MNGGVCCLCGGADGEVVGDRLRDFEYGAPGVYRWLKCRGCGLIRLDPVPTREVLALAYPQDYLVYMRFPRPLTFALAFVVIAGLQHHLSIIQHEAVHFLLFRNRRWNEWVGSLAAYPIGFTMGCRKRHFEHHYYLGTDKDPDLANYEHNPNKVRVLMVDILRDLAGVSAISQFVRQMRFRAPQCSVDESFAARGRREWMGLLGTQAGMFAMFWSVGHGRE
jgi:fatty acid desaturase